MPIAWTLADSPLGELLVTDHGCGLSGVYFPDHRRGRRPQPDPATWVRDPAPFADVVAQLSRYLDGELDAVRVPIDPRGTPFQRQVWDALHGIERGTTVTYGALAQQVGRPTGARAVAAAVGANPLSIVVPCHRVVGADGRLTGYAGGLDRKRWLLALEGVTVPA